MSCKHKIVPHRAKDPNVTTTRKRKRKTTRRPDGDGLFPVLLCDTPLELLLPVLLLFPASQQTAATLDSDSKGFLFP